MLSMFLRAFVARLRGTPMIPVTFGGREFWLHTTTGRILPKLAGADDGDTDDAGADDDASDDDGDNDSHDEGPGDDANNDDTDDSDSDEDKLPDNVKAILRKEREARRKAERTARRLRKQAKERDTPNDDKPDNKGDVDEDAAVDKITLKLRKANLRAALVENGVPADRVKAAVKLLADTDIEYDQDDEPDNLEEVLEEAFAVYPFLKSGEKPHKPKPPKADGDQGGDDKKSPPLTADELQFAKAFRMTPEQYAAYRDTQPELPAKTKTKE